MPPAHVRRPAFLLEPEDNLTEANLCELLRRDRMTIYRWRMLGGMPFYRVGPGRGTICFSGREVEAWLLTRRNEPSPPPRRSRKSESATPDRRPRARRASAGARRAREPQRAERG